MPQYIEQMAVLVAGTPGSLLNLANNVRVNVPVVWADGVEEWRPARAIRWTSTHVMVGWVEESGDRRDERWEWLRAQDVMRSVRWLVPPARA